MEKQIIQDTSEKLKLFKNTKGFNWEIVINEINIDRLEKLNNEMIEKFGYSGDSDDN